MSDKLAPNELTAWATEWDLAPGVTYLNHGSFGPPPRAVQAARRDWQSRLDSQPMEFFYRRYEDAWHHARRRLAEFVGADPQNMVFAENATSAMNIVARNLPLRPSEDVVLTDHEYGAVRRIWDRASDEAGSAGVRIARLPVPAESSQQIVDAVMGVTDEQTRLLVVSQITSATAITLPVQDTDSPEWYASMALAPLPASRPADLQKRLWTEHGIEIPITVWDDRSWIRVSCHLYNTRSDIDRLIDALHNLL